MPPVPTCARYAFVPAHCRWPFAFLRLRTTHTWCGLPLWPVLPAYRGLRFWILDCGYHRAAGLTRCHAITRSIVLPGYFHSFTVLYGFAVRGLLPLHTTGYARWRYTCFLDSSRARLRAGTVGFYRFADAPFVPLRTLLVLAAFRLKVSCRTTAFSPSPAGLLPRCGQRAQRRSLGSRLPYGATFHLPYGVPPAALGCTYINAVYDTWLTHSTAIYAVLLPGPGSSSQRHNTAAPGPPYT